MEVSEMAARFIHELIYRAVYADFYGKSDKQAMIYTFSKYSTQLERELLLMARKQDVKSVERPILESIKWVNRNLSDEEKGDHDGAKITPQAIFKDLLALSVQGYNFALKWDAYSSGFQATLIPYNKGDVNWGYGLSARSSDPFRAISLLLYKHFKVMGENWSEFYNAPKSALEG